MSQLFLNGFDSQVQTTVSPIMVARSHIDIVFVFIRRNLVRLS